MLNKLLSAIRRYQMVRPGDRVVCAVSGGADSMALLWSMYLLKDKLDIQLEAAHFNHGLRGEESDRDEAFVKDFCHGYGIPCHTGAGRVIPGNKGLEAAARDARYRFLNSLSGKIATAHTADDNAETVLMHLVRGTGLKGLGGIAPVNGGLVRPMLDITRREVLVFLEEYHIPYVEDSSNATDDFLRNRLRHHVMPLLQRENPKFSENTSAMAMRLRQDAQLLDSLVKVEDVLQVEDVKALPQAQRSRVLSAFLVRCGVKEPASEHIFLAEKLLYSDKPSARADFPGNIVICRNYGLLRPAQSSAPIAEQSLPCPGSVEIPQLGVRIVCEEAVDLTQAYDSFAVEVKGNMILRSRQSGDRITLGGGSKRIKSLLIDRKIPAAQRNSIPVIADDDGILGVYSIGADCTRMAQSLPALRIRFEKI